MKLDANQEFDQRVKDWARDAAGTRPEERTAELNERRRLLNHLFHRAAKLLAGGALEPEWADEIRAWSGKTIWRDVVLPMEREYHTALGTSAKDAMRAAKLIEREFFPGGND